MLRSTCYFCYFLLDVFLQKGFLKRLKGRRSRSAFSSGQTGAHQFVSEPRRRFLGEPLVGGFLRAGLGGLGSRLGLERGALTSLRQRCSGVDQRWEQRGIGPGTVVGSLGVLTHKDNSLKDQNRLLPPPDPASVEYQNGGFEYFIFCFA